jgi:double-strand break repair protein MRE11
LSILPQNSFGDAVAQFIDKDDKHAMEMFVNESLESQVKHLLALDREDDGMDDEEQEQSSLVTAMEKYRGQMENMFSKGVKKRTRGKKRVKPKPDSWDSEFDGVWEDQPGALIHSDNEGGDPAEEEAGEGGTVPAHSRAAAAPAAGRGRGRGRGAAASARTTKSKATPAATKGRKKQVISDGESDVIMLDDDDDDHAANVISDDDDDSQALFVKQPKSTTAKSRKAAPTTTTQRRGRAVASPAPSSATVGASASRRAPRAKAQSTLNFGSQASVPQSSRPSRSTRNMSVLSDGVDDDDDDDDAFEEMPSTNSRRRR